MTTLYHINSSQSAQVVHVNNICPCPQDLGMPTKFGHTYQLLTGAHLLPVSDHGLGDLEREGIAPLHRGAIPDDEGPGSLGQDQFYGLLPRYLGFVPVLHEHPDLCL